jgi:glycine/D-amino acid oxidase-like deaminating enzyme
VAGLSAAHELAERGFEAASVTIGRENPQIDGTNGPGTCPASMASGSSRAGTATCPI